VLRQETIFPAVKPWTADETGNPFLLCLE